MQLELISRYPPTQPKGTPLLFVHGSFAGAEVWDRYFLPYFAARGYESHAVSLRGHGASAGHDRLPWWSLSDYVADLTRTVAALPRPPVLIGHSLGGMVVQKYLESAAPPGVVLMASVPPHGVLASLMGLLVSNPLLLYQINLIQSLGPRFASLNIMRKALFSDNTPDSHLMNYIPMFQGESQRVSLDMLGLNPLRLPRKPAVPMLVMGAEHDVFISTRLVQDTARYYQTEAVTFADMAHAMMLEAEWERVAGHLLGWLDSRFAAGEISDAKGRQEDNLIHSKYYNF